MGLDSVEFRDAYRMDTMEQLGLVLAESICGAPIVGKGGMQALPESPTTYPYMNANTSSANVFDFESSYSQLQVLLQAQVLLKASGVYLKLDEAMHQVQTFRTNLHTLLIKSENEFAEEEEQVGVLHRDTAVSNLRFLNIFYGYSPQCFALAVNLLDRLLSRVKTHPRYLSCVATSCFYIAAKIMEERRYLPAPHELVKLSQCGGTAQDLLRMERLILEKIQYQVQSVNSLTFLQYFCELLACKDPRFDDHSLQTNLIAKLEVLLCQFEFAKYKAETLALALLSCVVQEMDLLGNMDIFTALVELEGYCQISDEELLQCRGLVIDYLNMYRNQRSKLPRLQLVWTVSRRTLNKMKPSTRILLDLEPIFEDEDDETQDSCDDSGPFDSENELEKPSREYSISITAATLNNRAQDVNDNEVEDEAEEGDDDALEEEEEALVTDPTTTTINTGNDGNNNVQRNNNDDTDDDDGDCCPAAAATTAAAVGDPVVVPCGRKSFIQVHSNAADDASNDM